MPPAEREYCKNAEMMPPGERDYRENAEILLAGGREYREMQRRCLQVSGSTVKMKR